MSDDHSFAQYYKDILLSVDGHKLTVDDINVSSNKASEGFSYFISGYKYNVDEILVNGAYDIDFSALGSQSQEVVIKDIKFTSICKHHLLPFFGCCDISYVPNKKIIGFSRVTKLVKVLSLRMQLQEILTYEIANSLIKALDPKSLSVKISAQHLCMAAREGGMLNEIVTVHSYIGVQ